MVVDGELYVPSAMGARRRWTKVAMRDRLVRLRTHGQIYELRIERVTDAALRKRIGEAVARRYGFEPAPDPGQDATWYFHLAPRSLGAASAALIQ